jgi:hypothetical protein
MPSEGYTHSIGSVRAAAGSEVAVAHGGFGPSGG